MKLSIQVKPKDEGNYYVFISLFHNKGRVLISTPYILSSKHINKGKITNQAIYAEIYNNELLKYQTRINQIAAAHLLTANDIKAIITAPAVENVEAVEFFSALPKIHNKLKTLCDVGLGYVKLGQPSTELSGGEAQRVKLATELSKIATGKTIYILDEPTTGLHADDVRKLLEVLQRLVESGNTVVVIEHNLDVIKCADHIIDLGPEGGDGGGTIVCTGTPEDVAECEASYTGKYLKKVLET